MLRILQMLQSLQNVAENIKNVAIVKIFEQLHLCLEVVKTICNLLCH